MNTSNLIFLFFTIAIPFCDCKHLKCKPVICPSCDLQLNETVAQNQIKILSAGGPTDGTCVEGAKAFYHGSDYGLANDACCCMPVPLYPPVQCDPIGPGISVCPSAPNFYKDETIGDYYLQIGLQRKNSAPADGCCLDDSVKLIVPSYLSNQSEPICICFQPDVHPTEEDSSSCSSSSERKRRKH